MLDRGSREHHQDSKLGLSYMISITYKERVAVEKAYAGISSEINEQAWEEYVEEITDISPTVSRYLEKEIYEK